MHVMSPSSVLSLRHPAQKSKQMLQDIPKQLKIIDPKFYSRIIIDWLLVSAWPVQALGHCLGRQI